MIMIYEENFMENFNKIQKKAHLTAKEKGWYDNPVELSESIANIHGEVSEAWESVRIGNPESDHIKGFSCLEEELADIVLRIMTTAEDKGLRVSEAVIAKMAFNPSRTYRHGNKKF